MKKFALIVLFLLSLCGNAKADNFEAAYNTAQWVPVVLLSGTDGMTPATGKVYSDVTLWYKQGVSGTWTQQTLSATSCTASSGNLCEESSTNAPGSYRIYIPSTVVNAKGKIYYIVKGSGIKTYWGVLSVKTNDSSTDTDNILGIKSKTDSLRR